MAKQAAVPPAKANVFPVSKRRTQLEVKGVNRDEEFRLIARTMTRPEINAAGVIDKWHRDVHDVNDLSDELAAQVAAVNAGNLGRAEAVLIAQAHTLDAIFGDLMRRASEQIPMDKWETYMRIGLKAQNQTRMTLSTLCELKHPRSVAFVRQANISQGPQQVNNGTQDVARAGQPEFPQNQLLESTHGQRLDFGAASQAGGTHSIVEAMGKGDGATDAGGKGSDAAQCLERRAASGRSPPSPASAPAV